MVDDPADTGGRAKGHSVAVQVDRISIDDRTTQQLALEANAIPITRLTVALNLSCQRHHLASGFVHGCINIAKGVHRDASDTE